MLKAFSPSEYLISSSDVIRRRKARFSVKLGYLQHQSNAEIFLPHDYPHKSPSLLGARASVRRYFWWKMNDDNYFPFQGPTSGPRKHTGGNHFSALRACVYASRCILRWVAPDDGEKGIFPRAGGKCWLRFCFNGRPKKRQPLVPGEMGERGSREEKSLKGKVKKAQIAV